MSYYEEMKQSHWTKSWRLCLLRDTDKLVTINEIDRLYSIEYDRLYDNPVVLESLHEKIFRMGSWSDEELENIVNQEYHNHFSQMVKSNVTEQVWEIYWPRFQAEHQEPEPYNEDADVQRLEKQAEEAFESRLYGQSRSG